MRSALGELIIQGVKTNLDYQFDIINNQDYIEGNVDTGFIEKFRPEAENNA